MKESKTDTHRSNSTETTAPSNFIKQIIAEDIKMLLDDLGYQIVEQVARSYNDGIRLFESEKPDLVLVDIMISGEKDGIDLAEAIRQNSDTPLIFLTSHADTSTIDRAKKMNPDAYIVKPSTSEHILEEVGRLIKK